MKQMRARWLYFPRRGSQSPHCSWVEDGRKAWKQRLKNGIMFIHCQKRGAEEGWRLRWRQQGTCWISLVWGNIFWKGDGFTYVYRVLSHAAPILFCNIQCSQLFCQSVIYDEVWFPWICPLSPWVSQPQKLPHHPFLNFSNIQWASSWNQVYGWTPGDSLPCWGNCKLRDWICNGHNPNTKILVPKIITSVTYVPNSSTTCFSSAFKFIRMRPESLQTPQGHRKRSFYRLSSNLLALHSPRRCLPLFRKQCLFSTGLSIKKLGFFFLGFQPVLWTVP